MIFLQTGLNQPEFGREQISHDTHSLDFVFISKSPVMKMVYKRIKELSYKTSPILILGERGTGRSTVAQETFDNNGVNKDPHNFIQLFLHGLDQNIVEKTLFSTENGLLNRGTDKTLFIKGIEYLNLELQEKLLSYLLDHQNRAKLPRLICSSSEKISQKVKSFQFYPELFSFLSKNLLILPLLSERKEDILPLISLFNKQNDFKGNLSASALKALTLYDWPGNITELQDICSAISMFYPDKKHITEKELSLNNAGNNKILEKIVKYDPQITLESIINKYIQMSLKHFQSKSKSAKALGISVKTIYNKIKTGHVIFVD